MSAFVSVMGIVAIRAKATTSRLFREHRGKSAADRSALTYSLMLSRLLFFATNMQRELKSCAGTVIRCGPELAAVRFYNRTTDCQSHTHAFRLCRKESLEKMIETLGLQPNTGVLHGDENFVRSISARTDE